MQAKSSSYYSFDLLKHANIRQLIHSFYTPSRDLFSFSFKRASGLSSHHQHNTTQTHLRTVYSTIRSISCPPTMFLGLLSPCVLQKEKLLFQWVSSRSDTFERPSCERFRASHMSWSLKNFNTIIAETEIFLQSGSEVRVVALFINYGQHPTEQG